MKKRRISIMLALITVTLLTAISCSRQKAKAEENSIFALYLDYNSGTKQFIEKPIPSDATEIDRNVSSLGNYRWSTWYYVTQTVTITQPLQIYGNVNLVLLDGAFLNCSGGILVEEADTYFRVYSDRSGRGELHATGSGGYPGIGSGSSQNCGGIVINGGRIMAKGGFGAPGIGSGRGGRSGMVQINGGTVAAFGYGGAAGIGSGPAAASGVNVTINGGSVVARSMGGGTSIGTGAGVGGGEGSTGNIINIAGGAVAAFGATGIGGGSGCTDTKITMTGGAVELSNLMQSEVGIGAAAGSKNVTIVLESGRIISVPGQSSGYTTAIGGGSDAANVSITIGKDGGEGPQIKIDEGFRMGIGSFGDNSSLEMHSGNVEVTGSSVAMGTGKGTMKRLAILGGSVKAVSTGEGAGIGSAEGARVESIVIEGVKTLIEAVGGSKGAGIGAGAQSTVREISISGASVKAEGHGGSAGIGAGAGTYEAGKYLIPTVRISGCMVTASAEGKAMGIGGAYASSLGGPTGAETVILKSASVRAENAYVYDAVSNPKDERGDSVELRIFETNGEPVIIDGIPFPYIKHFDENKVYVFGQWDSPPGEPYDIHLGLNSTLRFPLELLSYRAGDVIECREIQDTEGGLYFSTLYYDAQHHTVVGAAKKTGIAVLRIEDRSRGKTQELRVRIDEGGGLNLSDDDMQVVLRNQDGTVFDPYSERQSFKMHRYVKKITEDDTIGALFGDSIEVASAARVEITTAASGMRLYLSGAVTVLSSLDPQKVFANVIPAVEGSVYVDFQNPEGKTHKITIVSQKSGLILDKVLLYHGEMEGTLSRSSDDAPGIYFSRSFPNTASLIMGTRFSLPIYVTDRAELASVTVDGNEVTDIEKKSERMWVFDPDIRKNGTYTIEVKNTAGKTATYVLPVHWFGTSLNADAVRSTPKFDESYLRLLSKDGKVLTEKADPVYLSSNYQVVEGAGEVLRAYGNGDEWIDLSENELPEEDVPFKSFTYPKSFRVTKNGFYLVRVQDMYGAFSTVVLDVSMLKTPEAVITMEISESGMYEITVDSSAIKIAPYWVRLNGCPFSSAYIKDVYVNHYSLMAKAGGTFTVEASFGAIKTKETFSFDLPVNVASDGLITVAPSGEGMEDGSIRIDPDALSGGLYDAALSMPDRHIYVPKYECALVEGEKREEILRGEVGEFTGSLVFEDLRANRYTLAVRDANDHGNIWITYVTLGKIPTLKGTLTIEGEPAKGGVLKAVFTAEKLSGVLKYTWYRKSDDGRTVVIDGAVTDTYSPTAKDYFCRIFCEVSSSYETGTVGARDTEPVGILGTGFSGPYDGQEHQVTFPSLDSDKVKIVYALIGSHPEVAPVFKDAGSYAVEYFLIDSGKSMDPYTGPSVSGTAIIEITPRDLSRAKTDITGFTYDGQEHTARITSINADGMAVPLTDVTISGTFTGKNAGKYPVKIEGGRNYSGSLETFWEIAKLDIEGARVILKNAVYDGKPHETEVVSIKKDGVDVDDYEMSGETIGTLIDRYEVTIVGQGNFTGMVKSYWEISKTAGFGVSEDPSEEETLPEEKSTEEQPTEDESAEEKSSAPEQSSEESAAAPSGNHDGGNEGNQPPVNALGIALIVLGIALAAGGGIFLIRRKKKE